MITAVQMRVLAARKESANKLLGYIEQQIRTVATNGEWSYKIYKDDVQRRFQLAHLTPAQFEELFRDVSKTLMTCGFNVQAFPNKLLIDWRSK